MMILPTKNNMIFLDNAQFSKKIKQLFAKNKISSKKHTKFFRF